mmetsp:Transcript_19345/g.32673  ORF Transcript_19345/g.32673 Transcript_19345/m.32673 type:complete len:209 (+) Transcript_19345:1656-2282(+)
MWDWVGLLACAARTARMLLGEYLTAFGFLVGLGLVAVVGGLLGFVFLPFLLVVSSLGLDGPPFALADVVVVVVVVVVAEEAEVKYEAMLFVLLVAAEAFAFFLPSFLEGAGLVFFFFFVSSSSTTFGCSSSILLAAAMPSFLFFFCTTFFFLCTLLSTVSAPTALRLFTLFFPPPPTAPLFSFSPVVKLSTVIFLSTRRLLPPLTNST